jgi:hypothetical protein
MSLRRALLVIPGLALAAGLVMFLAARKPPPAASQAAGSGPSPDILTLQLNWTGLAGRASQLGVLGTGPGQVRGFVGEYIVAAPSVVLRARAEVQNRPPLGSPAGNVAALYADPADVGVGVGSIADAGKPGSSAISGGGPHGSEIIEVISSGDPLLEEPRYMPPSTISIRIAEYRFGDDDLSLVLHPVGGPPVVFPPSVVEPRLVEVVSGTYDLRFADLPGIASVDVITRFDVRSGWFLPATGRLSGGHFWLTKVIIGAQPRQPAPSEQYD